MEKSAFVNLFRTIWISYNFSVIPVPTNKRKKEDLHKAGKAAGQTKLTFAKKIKITEVCYSLHCCNKLSFV